MPIHQIILLLTLLVAACQNADLNKSGVRSGSTTTDASTSTPADEKNLSNSESMASSEAESVEDELAITPVMIGGAFLTCRLPNPGASETSCFASDTNGQPISIPVHDAFVRQGGPALWMPAKVRAGADIGHYIVSLPDGVVSDFGIALVYEQGKVLMDWVVGSDPSRLNLVRDGSFENLLIENGATFAQLPSTNSPNWKARTTDTSNCGDNIGYLEVQNIGVPSSRPAAHGNQWLELDAACSNNALGNAGNMATYQDVSTVPGNFYLLRFSFARRITDTAQEILRVTAGGDLVMESVTTLNEWQTRSYLFKAKSNSARMEFEEKGVANRLGTLLDNVQVFDLGPDHIKISP